MIQFIHKLHALRVLKSSPVLDKRTVGILARRVEEIRTEGGKFLVAIAGGPGCGKSTLARHVKKQGLLTRPPEEFFVIDDLRGPEGERYSKRQVRTVIDTVADKTVLLFDYRAAEYVKNADLVIILAVDEDRRIRNLKNRSHRGYRKYRGRMFSVSPIPLRLKSEVYICREPELLKRTEEENV